MGDVSIMARRNPDGRIRFGWCGNGGYMRSVGATLLEWYRDPEAVDYLFSLGELRHLGAPHSEDDPDNWPTILRNEEAGRPLSETTSEREIFSTIDFVDFAYLYDVDGRWYYINRGTITLKIPLELVARHYSVKRREFGCLSELRRGLDRHIIRACQCGVVRSMHLGEAADEVIDALIEEMHESLGGDGSGDRDEIAVLKEHIPAWLESHDDWVVVSPRDEEGREVDFVCRPRRPADRRQETCDWCEVREIAWPISEPVPREDLCFVRDRQAQELYEAAQRMSAEEFEELGTIERLQLAAIVTLYFIRSNALFAGFYPPDDDKALATIRSEHFWTKLRVL